MYLVLVLLFLTLLYLGHNKYTIAEKVLFISPFKFTHINVISHDFYRNLSFFSILEKLPLLKVNAKGKTVS